MTIRFSVLEFPNPFRYADLSFWCVIGRIVRLDIDDGRAVDGIKAPNVKCRSLNGNKFDHRQPDRVGTLRSAAGEHSHNRNFWICLWSMQPVSFVHLA